MALPTPQTAAAKLRTRISQSGAAYEAGVNAVTVNPAEKAIAANDKWIAGIQDAIANDRFRKGLAGITLQMWKSAVQNYGVQRYTQGATKAEANYLRFAQQFFPFLQQAMDEVHAMDNNTLEDNINRMVFMVRRLHDYRNQ